MPLSLGLGAGRSCSAARARRGGRPRGPTLVTLLIVPVFLEIFGEPVQLGASP